MTTNDKFIIFRIVFIISLVIAYLTYVKSEFEIEHTETVETSFIEIDKFQYSKDKHGICYAIYNDKESSIFSFTTVDCRYIN